MMMKTTMTPAMTITKTTSKTKQTKYNSCNDFFWGGRRFFGNIATISTSQIFWMASLTSLY